MKISKKKKGLRLVAGYWLLVAGYFAIAIIPYTPCQIPNRLPGDSSPGYRKAAKKLLSEAINGLAQ